MNQLKRSMKLENYLGFSPSMAAQNILFGFGNVLFNGFEFQIKQEDKVKKIPITFKHFLPVSSWEKKPNTYVIIDESTKNRYDDDSFNTIRIKCAAIFVATLVAQPIGLFLNLVNRIGKILLFAHFWFPSSKPYHFEARLTEMGKDVLRVVASPFIFIGLLFAAAYGATIRPLDGRKLYATLERCAYSGGYHRFVLRYPNDLQTALIGLCFQPEPILHLFGGKIGEKNAW